MPHNPDEISLKEIIQKLIEWIRYLLSKWIFIVIAGITGGGLGVLYAYMAKPEYTASVSFILSNNSDANSGLFGLASQFGLNLGDGSNDAFMGDNIISLMTSRNMVQKALQQNVPGKNVTLANMIVKDMNMDAAWAGLERTRGAFPFPSDSVKFTYVQDSLFRILYETVRDGFLSVSRPDKTMSIYEVTTTSKNELFSHYLTMGLVNVTSKFYIDTKTSVARNSLNMLQHEADSLRGLLSGSISYTASVYDNTFNLNPAYQVKRAPAQEGQLNIEALGAAYGEVVKNLELAKISLQKQTPLYQIIDEPHLPLVAQKPSKLIMLILGGGIAGFVTCMFFICKKILVSFKR